MPLYIEIPTGFPLESNGNRVLLYSTRTAAGMPDFTWTAVGIPGGELSTGTHTYNQCHGKSSSNILLSRKIHRGREAGNASSRCKKQNSWSGTPSYYSSHQGGVGIIIPDWGLVGWFSHQAAKRFLEPQDI